MVLAEVKVSTLVLLTLAKAGEEASLRDRATQAGVLWAQRSEGRRGCLWEVQGVPSGLGAGKVQAGPPASGAVS